MCELNLENKLEKYLRRVFYMKPNALPDTCDPSLVEYFGLCRIKGDIYEPERTLWYLYCCKPADIKTTLSRIQLRYGKKKVYDIFRKPLYSVANLRYNVKEHFIGLKWLVKGNLLVAPPKTYFTDERMIKTLNQLYNNERNRLLLYIMIRHDWFKRYNDQKPPPNSYGLFQIKY